MVFPACENSAPDVSRTGDRGQGRGREQRGSRDREKGGRRREEEAEKGEGGGRRAEKGEGGGERRAEGTTRTVIPSMQSRLCGGEERSSAAVSSRHTGPSGPRQELLVCRFEAGAVRRTFTRCILPSTMRRDIRVSPGRIDCSEELG